MAHDAPDTNDADTKDDAPTPLGEAHGSCAPGCRMVVTFYIELAPIELAGDAAPLPALAFEQATPWCHPMLARQIVRQRPFDRGTPRVDRSTALRACTVLLI